MLRKVVPCLIVLGLVAVSFVGAVTAQEDAEEAASFIGAKRCKTCHKKDESGAQHGKWMEGPHAGAFESLASEESLAKAEELGLGNPQEAPECLQCHATAFAVMDNLANEKITLEEGVSCESCHGAGSEYKSKKTMKAITLGEIDPATVGLLNPGEETCVGCHNPDNPFHEEFDFETFWSEIAHPYPEGYLETTYGDALPASGD